MQVLKWKCAAVLLAEIELSFHWATTRCQLKVGATFRPLPTRIAVRGWELAVGVIRGCRQRQTRNGFNSLWTLVSRLSEVVCLNRRRDHRKGELMRSLLSLLMAQTNVDIAWKCFNEVLQ